MSVDHDRRPDRALVAAATATDAPRLVLGRPECAADGCDRGTDYVLCWEHRSATDQPAATVPPPPRRAATLGYSAAHRRLRRVRGRAAEYACAGCGHPPAEWAYDHQDPDEAQGYTRGRPVAYSLDPARYEPLCKSCHADADRGPIVPAACAPMPEVQHVELAPLVRPLGRPAQTRSLIDLRKPRRTLGIRARCTRCEMVKDLGAFGSDRSKRNGRTSRCLLCNAAAAAERYARNPEYSREYYQRNKARLNAEVAVRNRQLDEDQLAARRRANNERNARHRARAIEVYGGRCVWCGSTEDLEFDHPNNDGTAHREVEQIQDWARRVSRTGRPDPTWLIQLLCVPCHSGPGWKQRRAAGVPAAIGASP